MRGWMATAFAGLALMAPLPLFAQVATDGSVGARVTLAGPVFTIADSYGLRAGINLLHSFSIFNVRPGETATFAGAGGIVNIIARVTGGTSSLIEGTLRSTAAPNLFLVNPSGIVFGPAAAINIPGSFHASTAHYVRLEDGLRIDMRNAAPVTLSYAPPSAFGFEGAAAPISLSGTQLRVGEGRRISLVGGELSMSASRSGRVAALIAPSGTIGLLAAQSAGEALIEANGVRGQGFAAMGAISLRSGTVITAIEGPARRGAGAISIAGGNIVIDHSNVEARTVVGASRGISISAAGQLVVNGGNVLAVTTGAGDAGPIRLQGHDITLSGGALVDTSCDPGCTTGNGGRIAVEAVGNFSVVGATPAERTLLVSNSFGAGRVGAIDIHADSLSVAGNAAIQGVATARGDGNTITLRTGSISVTDGGQVDVSTRGSGRGGNLVVENTGAIRLDGTRDSGDGSATRLPSGFFANAHAAGAAGNIVISTATLEVLGGGEISSTARRGSSGNGGRIAINATRILRVSGTDANGKSSGIVSNTFSTGVAGDIDINADSIEIADQGRIQTQSEGAGHAGAINLHARTMSLSGAGQVSSDARASGDGGTIAVVLAGSLAIRDANSGLFAKTYGPARGGSVRVSAGTVAIEGGGIFAGTDGSGAGGEIAVTAARSIDIRGTGRIASDSQASGRAGAIDLHAATMTLSGRGRVSSDARATGDGGTINVSLGESLAIQGPDAGLFAKTYGPARGGAVRVAAPLVTIEAGGIFAGTEGSGPGGNIDVNASRVIEMRGGARIASDSQASGFAGAIAIRAGETLAMDGARITTAARSADGGDISIDVGRSVVLRDSLIETQVGSGRGSGGNIALRVPTLRMMSSAISANAFGGDGGNVRVGTKTFVPSGDSRVTASSTLGIDGTITFESPAIDPSGQLLVPPPAFLDVAAILAGRCGPRLAGRASSLVVIASSAPLAGPDDWRVCSPVAMAK